ncbi:MAG: hypothetical protein ACREA7_09010 [Nitrosotalea sp.]
MGYQTARDMVIAITSGGFVVALQSIMESLFGSSSNPKSITIQMYAGVTIVLFGLTCAILLSIQKKQPRREQIWEENRKSIVNFILCTFDDDFNSMKTIFQKLESRGFNFDNEKEEVTLEDIDQINPKIFKERLDKLPLIQNILGFITYEQYSALYDCMNYSSSFIDSLCKQSYKKDLLQSRANEAKKIAEFFSNEEKEHVGLIEWRRHFFTN